MRYFIYCRKSSEGEERQVLSLASQQEAIAQAFGDKAEIEIAGIYEEAKSAKTPGRPLFAEMLARIEAGEAEGIAAWAPDRLARNSIDGGHVIYLLDRGILRDLKFATYTFENNSQGKFMLSIMFGQSKYYSDALSENVKRGNATKVAMGWRPNRAPLGYRNCPATRTIIPDPDHFPVIRSIFDMFLTGAFTPRQLAIIARDDWGYLTPRMGRSGERPLGRSSIYQTLSNPFYKGVIVWAGSSCPGKHKPMVTAREFDKAQELLGRRYVERPQRQPLAFVGILSCGACGRAVTAERKTNRHGQKYTYYHCAARGRLNRACKQPSIEEKDLARQFRAFLESLRVARQSAVWIRKRLGEEIAHAEATAAKFAATRLTSIAQLGAQMRELTSLRLRNLLSDDEFVAERRRLEASRSAIENRTSPMLDGKVIELFDLVEKISKYALDWFDSSSNDKKRKLLKFLCSNPVLIDKKLSIYAAKPFMITPGFGGLSALLTVEDEVRTLDPARECLLSNIKTLVAETDIDTKLSDLKEVECLFHPPDQSQEVERKTKHVLRALQPRPAKSSRRNRPRRQQ